MALFCVVIRIDSVSLLRFPFLSPVQVFLSEICRMKCPYRCFSFHFYFLVIFVQLIFMYVLFLVTIINPLLFVVFELLYQSINAIFNAAKIIIIIIIIIIIVFVIVAFLLWTVHPY